MRRAFLGDSSAPPIYPAWSRPEFCYDRGRTVRPLCPCYPVRMAVLGCVRHLPARPALWLGLDRGGASLGVYVAALSAFWRVYPSFRPFFLIVSFFRCIH